MNSSNINTIQPYHWWLAIGLAVVVHTGLLLNYQQPEKHVHANVNSNQVIIGLKKLKTPVVPEAPIVTTPVISTPPIATKTKPVNKKAKPVNKKPKPVVKKPKILRPKVVTPILAPKLEKLTQRYSSPEKVVDIDTYQQNTKASTITSHVTSQTIINEKTRYFIKLSKWLEQHKKYPIIARRRNQQGQVTIKFVINAQGQLLKYSLSKPSVHGSLNTATIKMLERASPMPALPTILIGNKNEFEYTVPVKFKLSLDN